MPIFQKRIPDYKKYPGSTKTLQKDAATYKPDGSFDKFGGANSLGPYTKKGKNEINKVYYVAPHNSIMEYFITEILCQIGLNTPKIRLSNHSSVGKASVAKAIEGYIPIVAFLDSFNDFFKQIELEKPTKLMEINDGFELDHKKQLIRDKKNKKEYKISGNLFSANIAGILVEDEDFQPERLNTGLIRRGNRYFACFIDKDSGMTGKEIQEIKLWTPELFENKVSQVAKLEQQLFILNEISNTISEDENGESALKKIFFYPRTNTMIADDTVMTSDSFSEGRNKCIEILTKMGRSLISYYTKDKPGILEAFRDREKIRETIADKVTEGLFKINKNIQAEVGALRVIIVEDLRAPYYQHLFVNNEEITLSDLQNPKLINAILSDQIEELLALNIFTNIEVEEYRKKDFKDSRESQSVARTISANFWSKTVPDQPLQKLPTDHQEPISQLDAITP